MAETFTFLQRGGTAAEWMAANPILRAREMGLETDTRKFKVGDGLHSWSQLAYWGGSGSGADGASAYEIAVENGFVGTEAEWLASLQGVPGASAYEVAVSQGFAGTEAEWLVSLEGADGTALVVPQGAAVPTLGSMTGPFYYKTPGV